jgi:hypothetical protein
MIVILRRRICTSAPIVHASRADELGAILALGLDVAPQTELVSGPMVVVASRCGSGEAGVGSRS